MMTRRPLTQELAPVARRVCRLWLWRAWAWCWLAAAVVGIGFWVAARESGWWSSNTVLVLGGAAGFAALIVFTVSWRMAPRTLDLARQIEHRYPDLEEKLLAAVEQERTAPAGQLGYLQQLVIAQARMHGRQHDWRQTIPTRELMGARAAHLMSFVFFAAVLTYLTGFTPPTVPVDDVAVELEPEPVVAGNYDVAVEPGDTSVERGTGLLVMARFIGALPAEVTVVYGPSPESTQRLRMSKSLDDPVFGVRIPSVQADLKYHVEFAEQQTPTYSVDVFEFPRLVRADARLVLPEYTGVAERIVEDTRHVSGVQGTELTWLCHLNKPVTSAQLVAEDESALNLAPAADGTNVYRTTLTITRSQRFRLHLTDADGRTNKEPPELVVDRLENRPPELKLAFPARDMEVSPLQEVVLEASVTDDYGLRASGLTYTLADHEPETVVLTGEVAANETQALGHRLSLEVLEAESDQLVSYYFWADDMGPDGEVRRTMGDMFFAEVQPFEEVFRQGQQEASGGPPAGAPSGGQAGELARLQKQIINATWNLIRREVGAEPSAAFEEDVDTIRESQQEALTKTEELKSKARDLQAAGKIDAVARHMKAAIESLAEAVDMNSADPLMDALGPERKAYQALLEMRSREHRVSRGQQGGGGGGGGGGNRSQQQLDQLELSNKENRYETRSQANAQGEQAQREQSQALNRLSELARRQEDLNDRLKELQAALQEAETEQEKGELRRRLKRLREEEQEILRDLDEMRNRMDQPENQSRMADARQQLEQTRSNVRRASKALEEGMISRALTSGTRAQREMQELRDEFRKKMAGEFGETMQEMRQDARELAQQQHELGEKLESMDKARHRTLRSSPERKDVQEGLERQKKELAELLDRMRDVTEQAETSEPLLSKQLYDTFRRTSQKNIDKDLAQATNLFRRGFISEARKVEPRARKGIDELKEGVERAAESVLGDELEALRRARRDVQALAERAQRELEQKDPSQRQLGGRGAGSPTTQPGDPSQPRGGDTTDETRVASREATSQPAGGPPPGGAPSPSSGRPGQQGKRSTPPSGQQPGSGGSGGRQRLALRGGDQPGSANPADGQQPSPQPGGSQPGGQQQGGNRRGGPGGQGGGGWRQFLGGSEWGGGPGGPGGPITGDNFRDWSDRLRDVERMLDDPELRGDAARIREQARTLRAEFKRHSKEPNWDIVRVEIVEPLVELQSRIGEELARKESPESLVPIDRDPVPPRFAHDVRRYYERLGSGK